MFKISFDKAVFLYALTRNLTHRSLKYSCFHKLLEVNISKVRLHELGLFLQRRSDHVDDVIVDTYLWHLLVSIANGMYQNIVCDIPNEGEVSIILFIVHRDSRMIKLQFALLQYE